MSISSIYCVNMFTFCFKYFKDTGSFFLKEVKNMKARASEPAIAVIFIPVILPLPMPSFWTVPVHFYS
jgi:hypothetical protein